MFYLFAMHNLHLNLIHVIINFFPFYFISNQIEACAEQSCWYIAANRKMCKRQVQVRATTLEGQYRHYQPLSCCSINLKLITA